eukprot:GHUV01058807.1.p1 GENE.GHUV01058807.1~~GHUV01058807.1.p1  ORF type:complete len:187 (-),score=25.45 GHUV01058807.1:186-746(-)
MSALLLGFRQLYCDGPSIRLTRCFCHCGTRPQLTLYLTRYSSPCCCVCACSPAAAKRVQSQLCAVIRPMYSSPPMHGAAIVVTVLSDPQLYSLWKRELADMSARIQRMRTALKSALLDVGCPGNWDHITNQIGMFSFTGLNRTQCENMTKQWHVYMTMDGRISMAGLSASRAKYLAEAIKDSVTNC